MDASNYNLSVVFEKTQGWDFGEASFSVQMLQLLSAINGKATIAELVETLQSSYEQIFSDLQQLHDLHLIKMRVSSADTRTDSVGKKKINYRGVTYFIEEKHSSLVTS